MQTNITYQKLVSHLKKQNIYPINIKSHYCVIMIPKNKYHISIFQDQWDNYYNITNKPYHLFHISSNDEQNRCSSYFWVDMHNYKIKKIPKKYFMYGQTYYGFNASTRNPCDFNEIMNILKILQKLLNNVV